MSSLIEELPADLERRFGGLARLYGAAGAQRIRQAHIVVVGLGGVGSWAAEAAARSGVARLTLIDLDHIAESNINRQVHALDSTLGQAKVQAMRERIAQIHPGCRVDGIEEFVDAANWPGILGLENGFGRLGDRQQGEPGPCGRGGRQAAGAPRGHRRPGAGHA
jgi:tRNA A37 threonylcarbamoyladenosine dehydratase